MIVRLIKAEECRVGMTIVMGNRELPEFFKVQEIHMRPMEGEGLIRLTDGIRIPLDLKEEPLIRILVDGS